MKHDPSQPIPPRPENVSDLHWDMFVKYHSRESKLKDLAKYYRMPYSRAVTIMSKIADKCKYEQERVEHEAEMPLWMDAEENRRQIRERYHIAEAEAVRNGSDRVTFCSPNI